MYKFFEWCRYYHTEITWFIVGFLVYAGLEELSHGNIVAALINFGLAFLNYSFYRKN
jgi:uncharacterized protein (DUF486 family)